MTCEKKSNIFLLSFVLLFICALCALLSIEVEHMYLTNNKKDNDDVLSEQNPIHKFNVSRGVVITLQPEDSREIIVQARRYLDISNVSIFQGINGTQATEKSNSMSDMIALYTRYVMVTGRSDHMQLSNPSMLGCLLSHIHVWKNNFTRRNSSSV